MLDSALLRDVSDLTGIPVDQIGANADLLELGLDSVNMMRLANRLRRAGCNVTFAELLAAPTLSGWRELLQREPLSEAESGMPRAEPAEPAGPDVDGEPFELATMQHAYWVGRAEGQHLGGVAAHFYNEFDGQGVDPGRLELAVRALFARHGMLRVRVLGDGRQQIFTSSSWSGLKVHDLRGAAPEQARLQLDELREALSHRQMKIEEGEVFDIQLSLLPDGMRPAGTRVHVNLDMVAADALSLRVLLDDLAKLYLQPDVYLEPLRFSFPRYLEARRAQRTTPAHVARLERDRAYWQGRLPELPGAPLLPGLPDAANEPRVVRRHRWLEPAARAQLERAARQHGVTVAMTLAAVLAEALTAYSFEPDFIINVPLFDREPLHADVGGLVGDFTSSILLEWRGSQAGTFAERAARLQARFHQDAAHASVSGVEVLRDASRLQRRQMLAPVVFTSALGLGDLFGERVRSAFGRAGWIISQGPQVWLDAQVTELDGGILVNWDARESAFAPGVLDDMFAAFSALLVALQTDGATWDAAVGSLVPARQLAERACVNQTEWEGTDRRLHDGFFLHARRHPAAAALLWGDTGVMTYGELSGAALRVAAYVRERGVGPGDVVAICLPKGPDQVIAALGVLAAGAAYLPLNLAHPVLRRQRVFASAGAQVLIDDLGCIGNVAPLAQALAGKDTDLAYVLYTSGSTGEPKGVELQHAAAMNTIADLCERFALGPSDRTLALSALDFDLSVFDIFGPLSLGGAVVCVAEAARRDAEEWVALARRHAVTVINCVPALAEMLVSVAEGGLPALRLALLGGDWVPLNLPVALRRVAPACRFVALGGTTETAIHSTIQEVDIPPPGWTSIPYGTPLRNVCCRVVDGLGRDRPDWVAGELWIGGAGLARGYRGDPARTSDRFVFAEGRRWYRTGDLARYLPGAQLEFLGRMDRQVKVLGNRIELGEVEAALDTHPGLARGVALVSEDGGLAAAVVPRGTAAPSLAELREYLRQRLPEAMLPRQIAFLTALPLSANGKVDRAELRKRLAQLGQEQERATPPRGELERRVAEVWCEVLGRDQVGREQSFFALGGDSLQATRTIARLRERGFAAVTLRDLFSHPRLEAFAACLGTSGAQLVAPTLHPDQQHRQEPFPVTDVQRAYLLGRSADFTLGGVGCYFYREYEIDDLDVARLEAALDRLVRRHEMLRAVFDDQGGQRILSEVPRYRIAVREAGQEPEVALAQLRAEASCRVFDPREWPLFAIDVLRQGRRARVAIGLDNLILDALSILIFYRELGLLYADLDAELPPADASFRDYVLATARAASAADGSWRYWQERLPQLPPSPQLPLAVDPASVRRPRFVRRERTLDRVRWAQLQARARQCDVTPSAVLLNAYATVLGRWSKSQALTLNLTLFDRQEVHPHVGNVLGDFTTLVLVAGRPQAGESWRESVHRLQAELWGALDHRDVSAVRVLEELARRNGDPETTMPVVFTSALGLAPVGSAASMFERPVWGLSQTPQVWLDHQVTDAPDGGVCLTWDAVDELFPEGLLDAMFEAYLRLLQWLSTADWTEPVLDLLPDAQRRVREQVNATGARAAVGPLHREFFELARRSPERIALLWNGEPWSYGELAAQALRLAGALSERGVARGDRVVIRLPKGPHQVVAVLAVLACAAAYVPVGVDQPPARVARICRTAAVRHVISDEAGRSAMESPGRVVLTVEEAASGGAGLSEPRAVTEDELAYIIFTSGSTGEPKGVEMTHGAAANTIYDVSERCRLTRSDRVLALSALDFDLSVYDLFGPLSAGGALVLIGEEVRREASAWLELMTRHQVTVWNSVPALLEMLVAAADGAPLPASLRVALVSGDWIGLDLPERLALLAPRCRFLALGGATEAAIWSNVQEVLRVEPSWRSIPYGRPLHAQRFRVVNDEGRDCPDYVPGELWIGGAGVARGYSGEPELTQQRFVLAGGERWYRTGDLGRYWPDGTLEFLGRMDSQIKLRGHRIELGEIESALRDCPGVGQALAAVAGSGAARHLVAAVVPVAPAPAPSHGTALAEREDPARAQARELEALAVEQFLVRLLGLDEPLAEVAAGWSVAARTGVAGEHWPVLRLWLSWLVARGVLEERSGLHVAGPRFEAAKAAAVSEPSLAGPGTLVGRAQRRLMERMDDVRGILRGRLPATILLDDDTLAPESLSAHDPGTALGLAELVTELRAGRLERPVELVELGGRDGRIAELLLQQLEPRHVRYTLLDESPAMLASAAQRLRGSGHRVECVQVRASSLPEHLRHRFDLVLSVNSLHRYPRPEQGALLAGLLARGGGRIFVLERCELTPLALLTAALLDGGYIALDPERRQAQSPLLPAARWAASLAGAGFVDLSPAALPGTFTERIWGRRPASALTLVPSVLREQLAARLPAQMIPEHIEVLPWLPLSANGKVDRSAVAALVEAQPAPERDQPPSSETEKLVASIWSSLLGVGSIGRGSRFFQLGGDSLQATRFLAQVRKQFGVELPLRHMFVAAALANVAEAIDRARGQAGGARLEGTAAEGTTAEGTMVEGAL